MSIIILPYHVGQAFSLYATVTDSAGNHLPTPTIADGDVTVQFGPPGESPPNALQNKHGASPGAGEFRSDVEDGFVKLSFADTDHIHHEIRITFKDASGSEWVGWQQKYQTLFKEKKWDDPYLLHYGYDGATVVAHQVASKIQVSNGDSPETFRDVVTIGPLVHGPVP